MKSLIYLSFCLILFISCSNSDDDKSTELICSTENPIEDLDWLKSEIESFGKYESVVQNTYENKTIFIFNNCNPRINSVIPVKDCTGKNIGIIGKDQENIPFNILQNGTIIWKPENFECDL
ncbi:MAG: hypothetical protein ACSHW4_10285 [Cellulophaga sp.]